MEAVSKERIDLIKLTWSQCREKAMKRFKDSGEPVWHYPAVALLPVLVSPYAPEITVGDIVEVLTFIREFGFTLKGERKLSNYV